MSYYKKRTIQRDTGLNEGKTYKEYLAEAKKKNPGLYSGYRDNGITDCNLGEGVSQRNKTSLDDPRFKRNEKFMHKKL